MLVDFGLALIPFISTGHVKAANRAMNAMESSADAGKGVRRTAQSGLKSDIVKKDEIISRLGRSIHSAGKHPGYARMDLRGLTRGEILDGTNMRKWFDRADHNPAETLYIFRARQDFKASTGWSEHARIFEEVQVKGHEGILELIDKIDLHDANLYYPR